VRTFTQVHAQRIAEKLEADFRQGKSHKIATICYCGHVVAEYGIRRSSREVGHNFIPKDLHVSRRETEGLAQCWLSKDDYFELLRQQGKLPEPDVALEP
jgi:hypothetical protein